MKPLKDFITDYDDYEEEPLYQYRMVFHSINKHQRDYLVAHFQDYSGGQGLAIVRLSVTEMPKVRLLNNPNSEATAFEFISSKDFIDILPPLTGKEQFLSNMFYDAKGLSQKTIRFYLEDDTEYDVEISKYGGITNILSAQQNETVKHA